MWSRYWCLHKAVWSSSACTNILILQKRHLGFLPQPNILNNANLISKISELSLFSISSALIHLTTSNRILIFSNQKCHSSVSNPIRCKIGSYTSWRLSRTQKCFAVAAIKLFNRLPEEIKSLPDRQFQCYMKRASQLATVGTRWEK